MKPAVSVSLVISTFNQPRVLAKALDSLPLQTRPRRKFLISDDGSDEPTRELVKKNFRTFVRAGQTQSGIRTTASAKPSS